MGNICGCNNKPDISGIINDSEPSGDQLSVNSENFKINNNIFNSENSFLLKNNHKIVTNNNHKKLKFLKKVKLKDLSTYTGYMIESDLEQNDYEEVFKNENNEIIQIKGYLKHDKNGHLIDNKGVFFQGNFKFGFLNGYGIMHDKSNNIFYKGYFVNNKSNDIKGKLIKKGEYEYSGEFFDGVINGFGKLTKYGSYCYKGEFDNNYMNGYGEITYSNNSAYKGQFKCGKIAGKGTLKYPNGQIYEGHFLNNKREGFGILKHNNEILYQGLWENNTKSLK